MGEVEKLDVNDVWKLKDFLKENKREEDKRILKDISQNLLLEGNRTFANFLSKNKGGKVNNFINFY